MKPVTREEIAKMIDHSLLHPTMDDDTLREGIELARKYNVASVCIKPYAVKMAAEMLSGSDVMVCTVVGFPHGNSRVDVKVYETEKAIKDGAVEIDMVVNTGKVLSEDWEYVTEEISALKEVTARHGAALKVIFENDFLPQDEHKVKLCKICSELKVEFVKTSTGYGFIKQPDGSYNYQGATPHDLVLMRKHSAPEVQIKAAGGVRTLEDTLKVRELGVTRIGATATEAIILAVDGKQTMRAFTILATALLLLFFQGCKSGSDTEKDRPNIIFIMSDDHAYQAISAYSDQLMRTPNIDRIADEGMLFTNACVTNSICAPSRAVILTGKHSHINGKIDNHQPFDTTQVTFPQLFQQAGYQTAMFGKLHFGNNPKGIDEFKILPGQGNYYNPDFITNEGNILVEGYTTDIITDMTLEWMKNRRDPEKPFMLFYLHKAPHREWEPAERHFREYVGRTFPEPATLFDDYEGRGTAAREAEMNILRHMNWGGDSKLYPEVMEQLGIQPASNWDVRAFTNNYGRMTDAQKAAWDEVYRPMNEEFMQDYPDMDSADMMRWRYQRYMQDYLASIAAVDEGVGQVLEYLDEAGLDENTLVVYTSDQGFYLGEHGWFDKRFIYDESFKTPLLVRWPGVVETGSRSDEMVQNLDFAQTLLEAAGIDTPDDMQGESLIPLLKGETDRWTRDAVYYHYYEYPSVHMVKRHYGIVTREYKLAHFYYDVDEWELYDRFNDPMELNNVYNDPAYADVVADLHERLRGLREHYGDSEELDRKFIELYEDR